MIAAKYLLVEVDEPSAPALESRAGGVGNPMWKPFQNVAQRNVRGGMFRRTPISVPPNSPDPAGQATQNCRELCDDRDKCCMMCVKPVRNKWHCHMYTGRFGGKGDDEIESLSMQGRGDEKCSYKDVGHTHKNCMAQ